MKTRVRFFSVILTAVLALSMMTGCSDRGRILNLISDFEEGCNSLDVKEILDTIDPRISDKFKFVVDVIEFFSGQSSDEMVSELFDNLPDEFSDNSEEIFSSIEIDVSDIEIDDDSAEVKTILEYDVLGTHYKREAVFTCVYYIDDWYISSIRFI